LNCRKIIKALKKVGFVEDRQKGSHLILINLKTKTRTIVRIHGNKDIKKVLVRAIIRDAGLTNEEFKKLI